MHVFHALRARKALVAHAPLGKTRSERHRHRWHHQLVLGLTVALCTASSLGALRGQEEDSPRPALLQITLEDCIALALKNNIELSIEGLNPKLTLADQRIARGGFEPTLSIIAKYDENTGPLDAMDTLDAALEFPRSRSETYRSAVRGLLPTGTRWEIFGESVRQDLRSTIETFDGALGLEITQPLLRGVGTDINLADLRIARRATLAATAALEARVAQLIVDVTSAYYELAFARRDYEARAESLELARQLLEDNEARTNVGTMSPLDVTQARSELATRRQELIASELAIIEAENALRRLIYQDVVDHLGTALVTLSTPQPNSIEFAPTTIAAAYASRPELRASAERIEQARIRLGVARSAMLPAVDLRFNAQARGTGNSFTRATPRSGELREPSWSAGVTVEVPLGLSAERGRRDRARLELEQSIREHGALRQDIAVQVSNAAGAVRVNEKRYAAAVETVRFARESLNAEEEKLRVGTSTTFLVTQLQRDLAVARSRELRSLADWHQAVAEYHRVCGVVLEMYGVSIRGVAPKP